MFPGMVYLIVSRDADFTVDMKARIEQAGGVVYVAASKREADRLWDEVGVEMVVWDPVFRVAGEVRAVTAGGVSRPSPPATVKAEPLSFCPQRRLRTELGGLDRIRVDHPPGRRYLDDSTNDLHQRRWFAAVTMGRRPSDRGRRQQAFQARTPVLAEGGPNDETISPFALRDGRVPRSCALGGL